LLLIVVIVQNNILFRITSLLLFRLHFVICNVKADMIECHRYDYIHCRINKTWEKRPYV